MPRFLPLTVKDSRLLRTKVTVAPPPLSTIRMLAVIVGDSVVVMNPVGLLEQLMTLTPLGLRPLTMVCM